MRMTRTTQSYGREGERIAVDFLVKKGYRIVRRNYRFGRGEIDIVAQDGAELVFVEVKTRRTSTFGEPEEAVTRKKQSQIRTVAEGYLFEHAIDDQPCRFDVIAVTCKKNEYFISHLENAF
jgi:putative endonuclease